MFGVVNRMFDALAFDESVHMQMCLQAGDIQLLNNTTTMHNRDPFKDGEVCSWSYALQVCTFAGHRTGVLC